MNTLLQALFFAFAAHFIGDFPLQGDFLANMKGKYNYLLFCHAMIWTGCITVVLFYFNIFAWWKILFLLIGHFVIDKWKVSLKDKTYALEEDLWIDQFLHIIQIILVVLL